MNASYNTLIWDWNGTLLNDLDICVSSINRLLEKRAFPLIDIRKYREVFTFPVKEYYELIGFDFNKESWDIAAHEFIDAYRDALPQAPLQKGSAAILSHFQKSGMEQHILSAMEQDFLHDSTKALDVQKYFKQIRGISNHYAHSKVEVGNELLAGLESKNDEIVMIGDTIHDQEVATQLNIDCILISHGHQSVERLKITGCRVVENFNELVSII